MDFSDFFLMNRHIQVSLFVFAFVYACIGIPPPDEITSLENFYLAFNGDQWLNNDNWMNGGDPSEPTNRWFGVTCDAGRTTVTAINFSNQSNLNGELPSLQLPNLQVLFVSYLINRSIY